MSVIEVLLAREWGSYRISGISGFPSPAAMPWLLPGVIAAVPSPPARKTGSRINCSCVISSVPQARREQSGWKFSLRGRRVAHRRQALEVPQRVFWKSNLIKKKRHFSRKQA